MLSPHQQAFELIDKSNNTLIVLPDILNGDALGAGLALSMAFEKLDKNSEIISEQKIPEKFSFLPNSNIIKNQLSGIRDFIISIDTNKNKISQLRYEKEENVLNIILTTLDKIEEKNIKLAPGPFKYDLIVTIDCPDLENLGRLYDQNTDLFFERPILNIDHKSSNEFFGEVNLVEPTASSSCEIMTNLIQSLGIHSVDQNIATCLLCGIVAKTRSFQLASTTPQALNLASYLITQGAEQEKIIRFLYKNKPLNCLKLWGRLINKMDYDEDQKILFLSIENKDFKETNTSPKEISFILDEINENFYNLKALSIIWQNEDFSLNGLIQTNAIKILNLASNEYPGTIKNDRFIFKIIDQDILNSKTKIQTLIKSSF